ncbi:adenosylmethionine decarboxylase [Rhodohalobacter sulfatireducens]|uniref:S-adenosylmethionine decarboxylase proenzyme n=1 Tax=Rhodohalobacter sulfatireducens TaxID=2911366 RepID=A0ABS9KHX1_9BACT|nr:adenosylmethionine decarboxylase [Rhodohalobacter sulfatireducens]MCG2590456.1 adenosylmethionine decarboxylase [Rhodohalobacter sulfatireducens]
MYCSQIDQTRTIVTAKQTSLYRIVTEDQNNWHLVANRPILRGEILSLTDFSSLIYVGDANFVDVILEGTEERKRIFRAISAVPASASCVPDTLEIPWCFMNHSCEPNTHDRWNFLDQAKLNSADTIAIRDIAEGEELTYDYDMEHYNYRAPFECQCGADSCRGMIRGFSSLEDEYQEKLIFQASPFVQERYKRTKPRGNVDMNPRGQHIVIDYWSCDANILNDEKQLTQLLIDGAEAANAKIISIESYPFEHQGVTAIALLAESHISIHTWPSHGYAGVDIYTCGNSYPMKAHETLVKALSPGHTEIVKLARGGIDSPHSITAAPDKPLLRSGLSVDRESFVEGTVPGRRHGHINHGFHITELIFKESTPYQECLIFDNPVYGRVLVLDGIVQLSTFDEHIYHEMLVHPPMFAHAEPKRVCIVGGGDGGTLREVLKHNPKEVVMIDIDEQFVRAAAKYLPSLSNGSFEDPRVTLLFEDASEALKEYEDTFDVAIIDCNDAIGPSEVLFEEDFYETVSRTLKSDGISSIQVGSILDVEFIQQTRDRIGAHLGYTSGFRLTMPSYHCGEYIFMVASKNLNPSGPDSDTLKVLRDRRAIRTKHWSPAIHHASQVLPKQLQ